MILVPGLCIALAASSNTMDSAVTIMFALLALSILLTAIGAVLGIIRIVKDVRRR